MNLVQTVPHLPDSAPIGRVHGSEPRAKNVHDRSDGRNFVDVELHLLVEEQARVVHLANHLVAENDENGRRNHADVYFHVEKGTVEARKQQEKHGDEMHRAHILETQVQHP